MITYLSPQDILGRMRMTYADCDSYEDSGCVTTIIPDEPEIYRQFWTTFVRPNSFRFEYQLTHEIGNDDRYIIAQLDSNICSWWVGSPLAKRKHDSLPLGLADASARVGEAAFILPSLLMQLNELGIPFSSLKNLNRHPDVNLNGINCFSIEGLLEFNYHADTINWEGQDFEIEAMTGHGTQKLLIEKTSLMLLRIDSTRTVDNQPSIKTITSYVPRMNALISEDKLKFDPASHT